MTQQTDHDKIAAEAADTERRLSQSSGVITATDGQILAGLIRRLAETANGEPAK